jgi:lipopolysaccharide transport system permease protein
MNGTAPITIRARQGGLGLLLGELWAHRELLYFLVWRELKIRYKQTIVGVAWAVLQPLGTMVVFTVLFGNFLRVRERIPGIPYAVFVCAGLVLWSYFANALSLATECLVGHRDTLTRVYFPRLLLPLSAVIVGLVDFLIALLVLAGLMVGYGIAPGWPLLLLPVFVLMAVVSALAVGLWLAALNALYRDFRYAVGFGIQLLFYGSPVIYSSGMVPQQFQWVYGLNPMAGVIEGFRWCLLGTTEPPGPVLGVSAAVVSALLIGGLVFFRRMESTVTDVI